MAKISVQVLVSISLLVLVALTGATPPGIAKNPSHATCKIKKYKHCYNLVHVCPKFCPDECTVECASCKPICVGSSNPPPDSPTPEIPTPPTPSTPEIPPPSSPTPPTPENPPPSSPTPPTPEIPTPPTPSTPDNPPPSSPTPPTPENPSPSSPNPPTPSRPENPPPSSPTPSTPENPPPSSPTPTPENPSPSTQTPPTPSTPENPPPSSPTPTPENPSPSTQTPPTPSTPENPPPSSPTPSTPENPPPSPSTPSPTTPSPSTPPSSPKRARCRDKTYPKCYNMDHVCPNFCPGDCEVDCRTCKPVCKCDRPGAICQDPRFIGGDGITFYFHGKKDSNFCLVSDPNLHINAHFIGRRNNNMKRDFTWVQSIAILFDKHQIFVGALKTTKWQDHIDRLALSFDGQSIDLDQSESATWTSSTLPSVSIVRTTSTNSVIVEVEGRLRVTAKVVPITEEDSRIHNYGITQEDCFAHLDLGFKFLNLSNEVSGVLGQTYKPNYVTSVDISAKMPVMGGGKEFETSSLFSPDCSATRFVGNNIEFMDKELSEGDSFFI